MGQAGVDRDYIRKAMDAADLNAVRMALYQNTGDPALAALPQAQNMSDEQRNSLKQQAVDWLEANASTTRLPEPDDAELRAFLKERLMPYQVPVEMRCMEDFPRTPSRKIAKERMKKETADPIAGSWDRLDGQWC